MARHQADYLSRRLGPYWKMERGCAFLFPPLAFALVRPGSWAAASVLALSLAACCATLLVGAAYWRALWARLEQGRPSMDAALSMAQRWKPYCCGLMIVSLIISVANIAWTGANVASLTALGFSILAVLEYINYYHVQLQNFDHGPTFRRFLTRRTFPEAHLAKDLRAFRERQANRSPAVERSQ
jgi:hypothetical protein